MLLSTRALVLTGLCVAVVAPPASAQGASTWFLAEGANNANFAQDILVGNPSSQSRHGHGHAAAATGMPARPTLAKTFSMAPTVRLTVEPVQ